MYRVLIFISLFVFSAVSNAAVSETGVITKLTVETGGIVSVWVDGNDDLSECPGGSRWTIQSSDALFNEKLALLIASASQKKAVNLYHTTGCGTWDSNNIYYVSVDY